MATNLEIENKYLVRFPASWEDLAKLFDSLIDIKRISQVYLKPEKGKQSGRIRKTVEGLTGDTNTVFHYNEKKLIQDGVHEEKEHKISASEYNKLLKKAHPDKVAVEKTRFVFKYKDQVFELDVFKGPLQGLAILEIELKNKKQKVHLPPFLKIIKEVTEDKRYTNFSLADKALHSRLKELLN